MKKLTFTLAFSLALGLSAFAQTSEKVVVDFPQEYKLKVEFNKEDQMIDRIVYNAYEEKHGDNAINVEELRIKYSKDVSNDEVIKEYVSNLRDPKPKLTVLEQDNDAVLPWTIYRIELTDEKFNIEETGLVYVVKGNSDTHLKFVTMKKPKIPSDFEMKWVSAFKNSKYSSAVAAE
jgi:ABC-type uncharacterized transport system YnjBCD substrate-binding protein